MAMRMEIQNFGKAEIIMVIIIFISRCKAHDQYISTHLSEMYTKDLEPYLLYTNFINVLK